MAISLSTERLSLFDTMKGACKNIESLKNDCTVMLYNIDDSRKRKSDEKDNTHAKRSPGSQVRHSVVKRTIYSYIRILVVIEYGELLKHTVTYVMYWV